MLCVQDVLPFCFCMFEIKDCAEWGHAEGGRQLTEKALWASKVLMSLRPLSLVSLRLCAEDSMMPCTAWNSSASGPCSGAYTTAKGLEYTCYIRSLHTGQA